MSDPRRPPPSLHSPSPQTLPQPWITGTPRAYLDGWWVVYDGQCAMCQRLVGVLARLDTTGRFAAVASHDSRVRAQLPWLDAEAVTRALQVVAPDGRTWQAAAAVEVIVAHLPRARWLAPLFVMPGVRGLAEQLYRIVARNRHRLGCGEHCAQNRPST